MVLIAAGCSMSDTAFDGETEDLIDMPTPPGNCSAGTGAEPCPNGDSSGQPVGGPCLEPDDCQQGAACVAPFEGGEVGTFTCTDVCIPVRDESSWCLDSAACCDTTNLCIRGLCVVDDSATAGSSDGSDTGDSGSGGGDSGSGSSGSSSGSESGGSSSTGVQ